MIRFSRHGKQLKCEVDVRVPSYDDRALFLYWDCDSEIFAGLLQDRLRDELHERLRAIRQKAYEDGFKDAKAKRKKRTYFFSGWNG